MKEQKISHQDISMTFDVEDCCEKIKAVCSVLAESDPHNFREGSLWRLSQIIEEQAEMVL